MQYGDENGYFDLYLGYEDFSVTFENTLITNKKHFVLTKTFKESKKVKVFVGRITVLRSFDRSRLFKESDHRS